MKSISVIGAGTWGTALSVLLAEKGFDIRLWARREELAESIRKEGENSKYLPGIKIPRNVAAYSSAKDAAKGSDAWIIAVPSQFFRRTITGFQRHLANQIVVSAIKGLEYPECKLMSQIASEELGSRVRFAVISGPNHAREISQKKPTACVVARNEGKTSAEVAKLISTHYFKAYRHNDVAGVEICGALKNVYAITSGVCDGFNLGNNAKASMITLSLTEMSAFSRQLGAKRSTVYGLAGVGDLIVTCSSRLSRNWFVGYSLASGKKLEEIKKDMGGMVAEGIIAAKSVYEKSIKYNLKLPLLRGTYEILFKNKTAADAIDDIMRLI